MPLKHVFKVCLLLALVVPLSAATIPLTWSRPHLDGKLDDACWQSALVIEDWSQPLSATLPDQGVSCRISAGTDGLYLGLHYLEASTNTILAVRTEDNDDIWQDDCVEIWIRDPLDKSRYDQFIANALSTRETHLKDEHIERPGWQVKSRIDKTGWTAEIFIPYSDLGRTEAPMAGEVLQLKLGRENYSPGSREATYSVWPAQAAYGRRGEFGPLHVGRSSFLVNPELLTEDDDFVEGWNLSETMRMDVGTGSDPSFATLLTPDGYGVLEQTLELPPQRLFTMVADIWSDVPGYLRIRTRHPQQNMHTAALLPTEGWSRHELFFQTGDDGTAQVILGSAVDHRGGRLRARNLRIEEVLMRKFMGSPIPLNRSAPLVVKALRVTDSRILRGFCGAPVDGSLNTWDWAGRYWEYNMPGTGHGVQYDYLENDGLHIRLEDEQGVDAIQVRGGVHARLVADVGSYDDPDSGKTFHTFTGKTPNSMALLTPRLKTSRISFYDVKDGVIADVGFYRLSDEIPAHEAALTYDLLPMDAAPPAVASLAEAMGELTEDSLYGLRSTTDKIGGPGVHAWSMKHPQHAVLVPQTNEVSLTALSLKADWRVNQPTLLTVQVRDPVHPMHSLTTVTIEVDRSGPATLVIDFPDQVIQAGKMVWLVLTPESELMLASPQVVLYTTSREAAVHEALPFHLLRMNGFYTPLSEGRPWNVLYRHEDIYAGWRERYADYWPYLESLMAAMAHCRYLDPGNALAEQVESWFYRRPNSRSGVSVLRPPVLPTIPDAPDWAIVARQAWLETRSVAEWWLLNRLVKTGEFGTEVNDDSCLYQNFANFPMFEDSGVGEGVQRAGREFWNHIVEDGYLEFGLNANQDDPLHAYEEGINHESMVAWWHYGDPTFLEQCMLATKSIESLTTVNAAGHRHFNSHFVSSADVRNPRPPESDGHCHAQLMHPVLEVARYNRNPLATRLLTEYAQSWLAHMQTPGEYATEIDTISDAVLATATEPFTEGMSCQMSVMLTAAEVNEDPSFVAPVVEYLLRRDKPYFMQGYIHDLYQLGYLDAMVWGGADGYADYFKQFSPAVAWAETGDKDHLLKDLEMEIAEIQTFRSIYTDIEPFADRVFLDNERKLTTSTIAYTGGYATRNKPFHSHAVSWGGFGTNFAAMVQQGRKDSFSAVLYNFAPVQLRGTMRLWNLEHGDYSMSTGLDTDGDAVGDVGVVSRRVTVRKGDPIPLHLTPRAVTAVSFTRLQARDPIWKRADLALSPRELKIQGSTLSGLVHNIGSQPAKQVSISLATRDGKVIETQELGALASPDDLVPRTVPFAFRQLPADRSDLVVIVDIRNVIDEITEGNNALRVVDSSLP